MTVITLYIYMLTYNIYMSDVALHTSVVTCLWW